MDKQYVNAFFHRLLQKSDREYTKSASTVKLPILNTVFVSRHDLDHTIAGDRAGHTPLFLKLNVPEAAIDVTRFLDQYNVYAQSGRIYLIHKPVLAFRSPLNPSGTPEDALLQIIDKAAKELVPAPNLIPGSGSGSGSGSDSACAPKTSDRVKAETQLIAAQCVVNAYVAAAETSAGVLRKDLLEATTALLMASRNPAIVKPVADYYKIVLQDSLACNDLIAANNAIIKQ